MSTKISINEQRKYFKSLKSGCELDFAEGFFNLPAAVQIKLEKISKKIKLVANWTIYEDPCSDAIESKGLMPFFIYADCEIKDRLYCSANRYWCQSSYVKSFHLACIFETKNTSYVLCNGGNYKLSDFYLLQSTFVILASWGANENQVSAILQVPANSIQRGLSIDLDSEQRTRIELIYKIKDVLENVFENKANIDGFMAMKNKNAYFYGKSPLEKISDGKLETLQVVSMHIDTLLIR